MEVGEVVVRHGALEAQPGGQRAVERRREVVVAAEIAAQEAGRAPRGQAANLPTDDAVLARQKQALLGQRHRLVGPTEQGRDERELTEHVYGKRDPTVLRRAGRGPPAGLPGTPQCRRAAT